MRGGGREDGRGGMPPPPPKPLPKRDNEVPRVDGDDARSRASLFSCIVRIRRFWLCCADGEFDLLEDLLDVFFGEGLRIPATRPP